MKDTFIHSKEWKRIRENAILRDCGKCFICGSTENLCVHHIWYRRGNKHLQSEIDNLITVCKRCHWSIHKLNGTFVLLNRLQQCRMKQYQWVMGQVRKPLQKEYQKINIPQKTPYSSH